MIHFAIGGTFAIWPRHRSSVGSVETLIAVSLTALVLGRAVIAQPPSVNKPQHISYYLPKKSINFGAIVPPPPANDSSAGNADLSAVHEAQNNRTADSIAAAQNDDREEDIFIYSTVLGTHFRAESLPMTTALSARIRNEAGTVTPQLKMRWRRSRPFVRDASVHPVCEQNNEPSYPSGHSMVAYLEGFALAQMVPERAGEILNRAHGYASNRVICGVHYPSDTEASYTAALVDFGALMTSSLFRSDLARAAKEIREALNLPLMQERLQRTDEKGQ